MEALLGRTGLGLIGPSLADSPLVSEPGLGFSLGLAATGGGTLGRPD